MLTAKLNNRSKNEFIKFLNKFDKEVRTMVRAEIEDSLLKIESDSASAVPVDTGNLKNSIQTRPVKEQGGTITGGVEVGAKYAPYVEFGTGARVKVPAELQKFAQQFKGKGGRKVNLLARPFFYPAVFKQRIELPKRIKNTLDKLTRR